MTSTKREVHVPARGSFHDHGGISSQHGGCHLDMSGEFHLITGLKYRRYKRVGLVVSLRNGNGSWFQRRGI